LLLGPQISGRFDLQPVGVEKAVQLEPVASLAQTLDWTAPPVVLWQHVMKAKPDATVHLAAGSHPVILNHPYGKGKVCFVTAAPLGNAAAIVYFCRKAQEVLQHRKLLGLFYGYLTQLNSERLLQEGRLGYERVWSCPDIDMICAPAKYGTPRSFEGASGYLLTVDSLDLHGKLVFHEVDHATHIARDTVENGRKIPAETPSCPTRSPRGRCCVGSSP
jgi:hypothetical protein